MTKNTKKILSFGILASLSVTNLNAAALKDIIENAKLDGFAFMRIHDIHGRDADGTRWQLRLKPNITTGSVNGFTATAGIFFSKGSSTPDNNNTNDEISGSRGDVVSSATDRFSIADYYLTYNAKEHLGSNTTIIGGQKSAVSPFNDTILDRELGIVIENKDLKFLNVNFQWWDTWVTDDIFITQTTFSAGDRMGFGNDMFMLGLSSGKEFTKDTGLQYNLWYALSPRLFDYMIFGDLGYTFKFGNNAISLLAQTSASQIADTPIIYTGSSDFNALLDDPNYNYAKSRGMYNIRFDYKYTLSASSTDENGETASKDIGHIGFALGYMDSFADGFGTMIDNLGALKISGLIWNSFAGTDANGFGIFGAGGYDNSSLRSAYAKIDFSYKKLSAALDIVYVDTTHYYIPKKAGNGTFANVANQNQVGGKIHGSNKIVPVSFVEITPSLTYKITDSINVFVQYGYLFGDLSMGRFRFQVNYVF